MKDGKKLRAALLSAFPTPDEMKIVVSDAEIKRPFSNFLAAQGTQYEAALLELLAWVEAQNLVEDLLRAAREKNNGNPELRAVFKELMGPIERELVDLEPLLTPLEALTANTWSLYDKIAKPGWERRARKGDSIVKMARDLARMPAREEQGRRFVPLLAFVEGLCNQIADASELDSWLGRTKSALSVISGAGATLVGGEASGAGGYILVQVRPLQMTEGASNPERSVYGVKAWLLGTERDKALLGKGPSGGPADMERTMRDVTADLPNLLDECRDAVRVLGVPLDPIRFELVVPRPLLHYEFDRMRVKLDYGGSIPLGAEHQVILRPQERSDPSRQQQMRDRYGDTFARVQDSCAVIDSLSSPFNGSLEACLFRAGSPGGNSLYLSLKSRPSCCICLLASVPPPNADDPQNDLYFTLLRAGVPAALWLREPPPADDLSDELSKFVRNRLFGEFPRDVLQERQLAEQAGVPWHRGRHLTLLWDDPRRPTSPDTDPDNRYRSAR